MKINDKKSIRGFFIYSESARYEDGDFVVYGNTIYVCSPKSGSLTVIGEKPYESENFYVYLGDQVSTVDEFKNFIENNGGDDKYVSLSTLVSILNTYLSGINNSGIIGHEYRMEGDEVVYMVNNKISEVYGPEDGKNILLTLLLDENINHGIFKVSKNLPEIESLVGDFGDYCILRQYSYYLDDEKTLMRIQELIDVEVSRDQRVSYANIYYRSTPINNPDVSNLNFQLATAHSYSLTKKATKLFNLYSTRMRLFEEKINSLQKNFCFTDIKITRSSRGDVLLQNTNENQPGYININSLDELGPVTLNILTEIEKNVYQSNTVTVEPKLGSQNYYISDDLYLFMELNKTPAESSLLKPITIVNNSSYDPIILGLGEFMDNSQKPEIYSSIEINSGGSKPISIDLQIPTNNLTLDFQGLSEKMLNNQRPIIFDYNIKESTSNSESASFKTVVYKSDGSLSPGDSLYKFFDFDGENVDIKRQYFLTLSEMESLKSPSFLIKDTENTFNLKFLNNTEITLYFPSMGSLAGESDINFEISPGEEKFFENSLITSLPERGIYVYSRELVDNLENFKLKFSILIDGILVYETSEPISGINQENLILWGTYTNPIIKFGDFSNYQYTSSSELLIKIELIESDIEENMESINTYSLLRNSSQLINTGETTTATTKSPHSTTTTTTPIPQDSITTPIPSIPDSPSNRPTLDIGDEITSVVFRLGGINASKSKISSAYCRKYFKPN